MLHITTRATQQERHNKSSSTWMVDVPNTLTHSHQQYTHRSTFTPTHTPTHTDIHNTHRLGMIIRVSVIGIWRGAKCTRVCVKSMERLTPKEMWLGVLYIYQRGGGHWRPLQRCVSGCFCVCSVCVCVTGCCGGGGDICACVLCVCVMWT